MIRKLHVVIVTLLFLTAVFPVALYLSIQKCEAWKQTQLQLYPPEMADELAHFDYVGIETTLLIFLVGPILAFCWFIVISKHWIKPKSRKLIILVTIIGTALLPQGVHALSS